MSQSGIGVFVDTPVMDSYLSYGHIYYNTTNMCIE